MFGCATPHARLKKENAAALTAALNRRTAPATIPLALLVATLKTAKKVYSPPPSIPSPVARINAPRPSTTAQAHATSGKLHIPGVSAFSIALMVLATCLALGAAIHYAGPTPPHDDVGTVSAAPRPQTPPQIAAPNSPTVGPAADARTIAAALTEANRDALAKSAPRPRANVHRGAEDPFSSILLL